MLYDRRNPVECRLRGTPIPDVRDWDAQAHGAWRRAPPNPKCQGLGGTQVDALSLAGGLSGVGGLRARWSSIRRSDDQKPHHREAARPQLNSECPVQSSERRVPAPYRSLVTKRGGDGSAERRRRPPPSTARVLRVCPGIKFGISLRPLNGVVCTEQTPHCRLVQRTKHVINACGRKGASLPLEPVDTWSRGSRGGREGAGPPSEPGVSGGGLADPW